MKKALKAIASLTICLMMGFSLFACSSSSSAASQSAVPASTASIQADTASAAPAGEEKKNVTIGCMPLNKEAVETLAEMMTPQGYEVEVVVFDGNNLPALALSNGEIDSLILNHLPWIQTFNKENNANLVLVDGFKYASLVGLYSAKHESIEAIPDGAQIIVSNDPANMDRALRLLDSIEFIKLGEKAEDFYTIFDIAENTKNIQFVEVETTSTAGSYEDADATITFSSVMRNAGYDATSYLIEDGESVNYPNGLFVNSGDEDSQWAKDIVKTAASAEYLEKFHTIYEGAYIIIQP